MKYDIKKTHDKKEIISRWYKTFGIDFVYEKNISQKNNVRQESTHPRRDCDFQNLDELRSFIMESDLCNLKNTSRNTVFSDGDPKSKIMIIGEAPGQEEDIQGKPFVGQSGQLLNNMLLSVGISREDVYISNIVFWRPPGNRTPSNEEISICLPYVQKHIEFISPKVLLLLGSVSIRAILNSSLPISKLRGKKTMYNNIIVIPSFHPAYLLRSPNQKSLAFLDMIELKKCLTKENPEI